MVLGNKGKSKGGKGQSKGVNKTAGLQPVKSWGSFTQNRGPTASVPPMKTSVYNNVTASSSSSSTKFTIKPNNAAAKGNNKGGKNNTKGGKGNNMGKGGFNNNSGKGSVMGNNKGKGKGGKKGKGKRKPLEKPDDVTEEQWQICWDFQKGTCKRGDKREEPPEGTTQRRKEPPIILPSVLGMARYHGQRLQVQMAAHGPPE